MSDLLKTDLAQSLSLMFEAGKMVEDLTVKIRYDKPEPVEVNGLPYVRYGKELKPQRLPSPNHLETSTLDSVADYILANPDQLDLKDVVVLVQSPTQVQVLSTLQGPWAQRHVYLSSIARAPTFPFGNWMDPERFIIALQTCVLESEHRAQILACVGNLNRDESVRVGDDGVTQTVSMRKGVSRKEWGELPSPIILRTWRTFPEVEQPESTLLLRVDSELNVTLLEADGKAWVPVAIQSVKDYLHGRLGDAVNIMA